jgi:predicted component of type VI protein secretion system
MRLIVTQGPNPGYEYILQEEETTIGRSANNSIVLPSPEISRRHAHLWHEGDSILLEDLGSTNGTFVNNARLYKQVALYDGDEIQFGDSFRLLFTGPDGLTRPITHSPGEAFVESSPDVANNVSQTPHFSPDTPEAGKLLATASDEDEIAPEPPLISTLQRDTILKLAVVIALLIVLWLLTFLFLDSYDQGRLIYCGNLNPFFNFLLGPFGFNPICH